MSKPDPSDPPLSIELARLLQLSLRLFPAHRGKGAGSIASFCRRNGFSRATYYNLKKLGKTPREMAVGARRIISDEAEHDWRIEREREAAAFKENA